MIDVNDYYRSESDFLKASDLTPGKKFSLTISKISVTEFGQDGEKKQKLTLSFSNAEKKLPLNKTNAMTIAHVLGDDAERWVGKSIFVYATRVSFGDKMVDAVRVDMPLEEAIMAASGPDANAAQSTAGLIAAPQAPVLGAQQLKEEDAISPEPSFDDNSFLDDIPF